MELAIVEGLIRDARAEAYGCPATIACAQEVAHVARGKSVVEAATIAESRILGALGQAEGMESSRSVALDALHAALGDLLASDVRLSAPAEAPDELGVLVGMSGGVDSAVAAYLLRQQGYRVVGVTLKLWTDSSTSLEGSCCSLEAARRARRVAHSMGIPHLIVDASEVFYEQVVKYFIESYAGGVTPNPCAKCNARVRFGLMLSLADKLGLARVATGHYARMTGDPPTLTRGVDTAKDQSYVLAEVAPTMLHRVLFPVGGMSKREVRAVAAQVGVQGQSMPESQEICFVPDDDHRRFLRERLGERPGVIVDRDGETLGCHTGVYNFTIGQRRGLRLGGPTSERVVRLDAHRSQVVVGGPFELEVREVTVGGVTWHRSETRGQGLLQLRSTAEAIPAHLLNWHGEVGMKSLPDRVTLVLENVAYAVAPGQTAVLYDGDAVVLGGTIVSTDAARDQQSLGARMGVQGPVV